MAIFAISFRIGDHGDRQSRWASVVDKIREEGGGSGAVWEETTSFFILQSNKTAADLSQSIYIGSEFSESWDKMIVVNLSVKQHATKGKLDYPATLASLMSAR